MQLKRQISALSPIVLLFSRHPVCVPGEVYRAKRVQVRAQVRQGQGPRLRHRRPHLPQQVLPTGRILRVSMAISANAQFEIH